jgi:hypothetical protein
MEKYCKTLKLKFLKKKLFKKKKQIVWIKLMVVMMIDKNNKWLQLDIIEKKENELEMNLNLIKKYHTFLILIYKFNKFK